MEGAVRTQLDNFFISLLFASSASLLTSLTYARNLLRVELVVLEAAGMSRCPPIYGEMLPEYETQFILCGNSRSFLCLLLRWQLDAASAGVGKPR